MNEPRSAAADAAFCANCGIALQGPYCHACGQHAHGEARSLGALFDDAWHVLTHLDARLWRTLGVLLVRPGELTSAFFGGRRARYLPPFRLYLVLSLLFFAMVGLIDLMSPQRSPARELAAAGAEDPEVAAAFAALAVRDGARSFDPSTCAKIRSDHGERVYELARRVCERAAVDGGAAFFRALKNNIPRMMFVFLPLIALVMRLMYWQPRRYYVEHLVFFLHLHAAFFLVLTLQQLLELPIGALPALGSSTVVGFAITGYGAWYAYRAMRRYYGQGRLLTRLKYVALLVSYAICLGLTLLGTVLISALTA